MMMINKIEIVQSFKKWFKRFSESIQFISALISLVGYLTVIPWLSSNSTRGNLDAATQNKTIVATIGFFNSLVLFIITLCLLCILWNIVLAQAGAKLRFVTWRKSYRLFVSISCFAIMLWGFNFAYVIFFGGAFFWYGQLYFFKIHAPWCFLYVLVILILSSGTFYRVWLELGELEMNRINNNVKNMKKIRIWNQRW
ncbi:MAG: hypothetical protein ABSA64_06240 [Sedimentisphaerales bacterium]|jgi:hypothetical protein